MRLYLDSTSPDQIIVKIGDSQYHKNIAVQTDKDIYSFINHCLGKSHASLQDVTALEVNTGPGSFTGTRVGVAFINALAFALFLKVNGVIPPVLPQYTSEPHITTSKVKKHLS